MQHSSQLSCRRGCLYSRGGLRPIPARKHVCCWDSRQGHHNTYISPEEVQAKLNELAARESFQQVAVQPSNRGEQAGPTETPLVMSTRTARNKVRAAELRAAALGLSQEDFMSKLQDLSLLLPGMSQAELMTAPSLNAELLLELCLDTPTVASRLLELRTKCPDVDVSLVIRQQPELMTDTHWRARYFPRAALPGHAAAVGAVALAPGGRRALSGSADGTIRLWDLPTLSCLHTFQGHTGAVTAVAVTPDGGHAVSGGQDGTLRIWDLASFSCLATLRCHDAPVTCLALTPDGRHAVSGSSDKALYVWDLAGRACVATLWGHLEAVTCVALSPDGRRAVSGSKDRTLRVWDLEGYTCVATLGARGAAGGGAGWAASVAVTPDGRHAVAGLSDSSLHIWDLEARSRMDIPQPPASVVTAVAVTPDGRHVLLGSSDDGLSLSLFDLGEHRFSPALPGRGRGVLSLALTADGRVAVSGGTDHTVCVWERGA